MITLAKLNDTHTEQGTTMPTHSDDLPGHQIGIRLNDLSTLHSQMIIMATRGHIGLWLPGITDTHGNTLLPSGRLPEDHRGCTHN